MDSQITCNGGAESGGAVRCTDWLDAIVCGDCLSVLSGMPDKSVDAVITDPPYNATEYQWDDFGNLAEWWQQINRVCRGACVLTAQQPIATDIINANRKAFRYEWVWDKVNKYTNFLNAALMPLRRHELVLVFAVGEHTYNPQKRKRATPYVSRRTATHAPRHYASGNLQDVGRTVEEEWPHSIIEAKANMTIGIMHPSQKPTALTDYLVATYTNAGDTVLDPYAGSGTTLVSAKRLGRHWIGIEKDETYVETAKRRLAQEMCLGV